MASQGPGEICWRAIRAGDWPSTVEIKLESSNVDYS